MIGHNHYNILAKKIEESKRIVEFRDFGDGTSQEWITRAEERLGITFPPSYVWWLKNYGGGEILGEEIFSIYEMDFDTVVGGDIVYMNELYRKKNFKPTDIIISTTDRGEVFYFKTDEKDDENEYPVYLNITKIKYAENFADFLKKRIDEVKT